jgi:hypothetical protein
MEQMTRIDFDIDNEENIGQTAAQRARSLRELVANNSGVALIIVLFCFTAHRQELYLLCSSDRNAFNEYRYAGESASAEIAAKTSRRQHYVALQEAVLDSHELVFHQVTVNRPAVAAHSHKDAYSGEFRHEVRASIAHERYSDSRHGQKADIHADVDDQVRHEEDGYAGPV